MLIGALTAALAAGVSVLAIGSVGALARNPVVAQNEHRDPTPGISPANNSPAVFRLSMPSMPKNPF